MNEEKEKGGERTGGRRGRGRADWYMGVGRELRYVISCSLSLSLAVCLCLSLCVSLSLSVCPCHFLTLSLPPSLPPSLTLSLTLSRAYAAFSRAPPSLHRASLRGSRIRIAPSPGARGAPLDVCVCGLRADCVDCVDCVDWTFSVGGGGCRPWWPCEGERVAVDRCWIPANDERRDLGAGDLAGHSPPRPLLFPAGLTCED